ncbi:hypothetical protein C2G38_2115261 [Gigaspora rosea]|uniref:Uncharacterized protein n=1 Tax=Gigaspora rosea TaxID=44941 RepID=A0A397UI15_9GLOM|nr:hypothetical protein C2G38_2115261 [Gigaspora rosea]
MINYEKSCSNIRSDQIDCIENNCFIMMFICCKLISMISKIDTYTWVRIFMPIIPTFFTIYK